MDRGALPLRAGLVAAAMLVVAGCAGTGPAVESDYAVRTHEELVTALADREARGAEELVVSILADIEIPEPLIYRGDAPLRLVSGDGRRHTLKGTGEGRILHVASTADVAVAWLTLRGGRAEGRGADALGGALLAGEVERRHGVRGGRVTVADTVFADNHAAGSGGAIAAAEVHVLDSVFRDNRAQRGSGGAIHFSGEAAVERSGFEENRAGHFGGALAGGDGPVTVTESRFVGNRAETGGGALFMAGGRIDGATFDGNATAGDGGAILLFGRLDGGGCLFTGNRAGGEGAAIYIASTGEIAGGYQAAAFLTGCRFDGNEGSDSGAVSAPLDRAPAAD